MCEVPETAFPAARHETGQPSRKPRHLVRLSGRGCRPNVKISKQAVLWIIYAMANGMSVAQTAHLSRHVMPMSRVAIIDWRHYVHELFVAALDVAGPMGGPGEIVEIDESLFRGKRKYNRGRLLLGNDGGAPGAGGAAGAGSARMTYARIAYSIECLRPGDLRPGDLRPNRLLHRMSTPG